MKKILIVLLNIFILTTSVMAEDEEVSQTEQGAAEVLTNDEDDEVSLDFPADDGGEENVVINEDPPESEDIVSDVPAKSTLDENIVEDTTVELEEFSTDIIYNDEHTVASVVITYDGECEELTLENQDDIQKFVETGVYRVDFENGNWVNSIAFTVLVNGYFYFNINVWGEEGLIGTKEIFGSITGLNNNSLLFEPDQSEQSTYEITSSDIGASDSRDLTLSYETNVSWTWTIPTELPMEGIEDDLTITVNNSNLATETALRIRLASSNDYRLVEENSGESLSYIITDLSNNVVRNDDVILDHLYNQDSTSNTIHFDLTQMPVLSGKYEDTLTFTASVERLLSDLYSGQVVTLSNLGTKHNFTNMKIYGVSKQDGTPTPDNPIEIQSVVNPTVTVSSGNLYDYGKTDLYDCTYENGVYTTGPLGNYGIISIPLIGDYIFKKGTRYYSYIKVRLKEGTYVGVNYFDPNVDRTEKRFHVPSLTNEFQTYIMEFIPNEDSTANVFYFQIGQTATEDTIIEIKDIMITTSYPSDYIPYNGKPQSATLNYTLDAIPVGGGGNITIGNQQYISDYVDIENKKIVKNTMRYAFTGEETFDTSWYPTIVRWLYYTGGQTDKIMSNYDNNTKIVYANSGKTAVQFSNINNWGFSNVDEFNEWLKNLYDSGDPIIILYALATPIEIDLTDSEVQAFKDLYTYSPTTVVSCSSDQLTPYIEFSLS